MPSQARTPSAGEKSEAIAMTPSLHWSADTELTAVPEPLVVEAPLAVEIAYQRAGKSVARVLAITMRTPGQDEELAIGFLLCEGLITSPSTIKNSFGCDTNARGEKIATWRVELSDPPREDLERVSRGLMTSSACGLCGRISLEGLPMKSTARIHLGPRLSCPMIAHLPEKLGQHQTTFFSTGGCHGAALCDVNGMVVLAREDVGRHNAVDKLIGAALLSQIDISALILVLSGRASFELIQKASAAGITVVVAVGAPSSLAVTLAHATGVTLVGFTRGNRFNAYSHVERLNLPTGGSYQHVETSAAGVERGNATEPDRAPWSPGQP